MKLFNFYLSLIFVSFSSFVFSACYQYNGVLVDDPVSYTLANCTKTVGNTCKITSQLPSTSTLQIKFDIFNSSNQRVGSTWFTFNIVPCPTPPPEDKCLKNAQKDAGIVNFKINGMVDSSNISDVNDPTNPKVLDKEAFKKQNADGAYYACVDGCIVSATEILNRANWNPLSFLNDKNIYTPLKAVTTARQCTGATSTTEATPTQPTTPKLPDPKKPQSQNDCPSTTTFGTVNDVPMCVKNAPPINASGVPQATVDDGKACVGNCDGWKPSNQPDTSNGKDGTGQGVDGDGQQGPSKNGGGTDDKPVDAKDEDGNGVTGTDKGFGAIKQDDVYTSKYKDKSFGAIWDSKQAALFSTPFLKGLSSSMPSFGAGGAAPVYTMNFSALKLGSHSFDIDSRIWLFIKACILLTASFTARKIIWG